mgnify:CR=1 FL=1
MFNCNNTARDGVYAAAADDDDDDDYIVFCLSSSSILSSFNYLLILSMTLLTALISK